MDDTIGTPAEPGALPTTACRALSAPATVNRAERTVDVIWSAGTRAPNYVHGLGRIIEELDMSPNAVRMGRLVAGDAPVLDTHDFSGARSVIGVVMSARIENGRGVATLRFSSASDVEPIWQRVAEGTLRNISVGYRVYRYEQTTEAGQTVHRAVDWELFEISVVPIPVDALAGMRGEAPGERHHVAIETTIDEDHHMPDNTPTPATETAAPAVPVSEIQPTIVDHSVAVDEALRADRARSVALDEVLVTARGLVSDAVMQTIRTRAIAEAWTPAVLRGSLFDAMAAGQRPTMPAAPNGGFSNSDPSQVIDAMADAIAARAMPGRYTPANERFREYMGSRPTDMVAEMLRARGEVPPPRNPDYLVKRAFHTISDFPLLLSAAANKMLLARYQIATPTYRSIMLRRDFRDFKPHRYLRAGDFPNLLPLLDNGEIQAGTVSESQETVLLQTFARRVRVTRQMLVNDDLGAFTDFAAMIGARVSDFENATAYALLQSASGDGPTLVTGAAPVFSTGATRLNKATAGTIIDITNVGIGRAAIMKQRTLDGLPLSIGAQMALLVGPDRELAARQIVAPITAAQVSNANVWTGFLQPVVEPLLTGNRWYLFSDPSSAPVYSYGYLNGAEGPQVTTGPVPGADGVEVSVLFDFGLAPSTGAAAGSTRARNRPTGAA